MKLVSCTETTINRRMLEIEIDKDELAEAYEKAFAKLRGKTNVPGFRKGKAPRAMIENYYGKAYFYNEAFKSIYPKAISDAIDEAKLDYVDDEVGLDIKELGEEGLKFTAEITVRPEVKLPRYTGIKARRPSDEVTDEDIDKELQGIRERNARTRDIDDRPVESGDTVTFDFQGLLDGVPFDGGTAEKYKLTIGSGQFIPGFEEQIIGKSIGEEFDVNVTFPEDYHAEELAGKPTVFKCKLHSIQAKEYFDIDDDFAKDFGDCDTLEEYRASLREQIAERKKHASDNAVESQIFQFLDDEMECVVPDAMIENRIDMEIREMESRLKGSGLSMKDYLRYSGMTMDDYRDQIRNRCEKQVRMRLAMEEVAKLEGITATEEEIDARVAEMAEEYSMEPDRVRALVDMDILSSDVSVEKAVKFLVENADITVGDPDEDAPAE